MKYLVIIAFIFAACSAPQSTGREASGTSHADAGRTDASMVDAGSPDATTVESLADFPWEIEVTLHDFSLLGPTDLIARSDGRAYVLLASAKGVRTGRPMAIVDLETGEIEQTSAAPIPLSKPYGIGLEGDDLFVLNESRTKAQPDMVYVDVVYYDASEDLWHVVPLPDGELMQSATYEMTRDGLIVGLYDESENRLYRFDSKTRTFTAYPPPGPEGCMAARAEDGDRTFAAGLRMQDGTAAPCAAVLEGDTITELPPPPSGRCIHSVVRASSATWLVGGYETCGATMWPMSDVVDVLRDGATKWERLPLLPHRVFPSGIAVVDDAVLIFDGALGVMTWVQAQGAWAHATPVDDMRNNSDWTTIGPRRVATLAWSGERAAPADQIVVYTFHERSKPTP